MHIENILTECEALLNGHFVLTSGRHAEQYMQCAKVQQYPRHMEAIAKEVAKGLNVAAEYVIAPAIGGIVFGYELARQLNAKAIFAERADGKMTLRRGFSLPPGAKTVVAEDVITTAGTVKEVIEMARSYGAQVVGAGVIVDRSGGKSGLDVPVSAAYTKAFATYPPDDCPLCKKGLPTVKPGSRA
jgi:orotate phosphoribosyltransferase